MTSQTKNEIEIFYHLLELGCCKLCILRYFSKKNIDVAATENYLLENNFFTSKYNNDENGAEMKKVKSNPCIICLGLLQHTTLMLILESEKLEEVKKYDTRVFTCSISVPASILVRDHSMKIYLRNTFKDIYNEVNELPLNKAWKIFIKNELAKHLKKEFENSDVCNFSINVTMEYPSDLEELENLKKMHPKLFENKANQHKKYNGELFSRKGVLAVLSQTSPDVFKENYPVPPTIPDKYLVVKDIECKHNSIFFAGRYIKLSRELSQTPWVIDGVRAMAMSVQEIIFAEIMKLFNVSENNLKFSSSGREDCDVRCLGRGRPFYIEIINPKKTLFSFHEFRSLEDEINKSDLIKVLDLQLVQRYELTKIKEGEEMKTKDYNALCVTKNPVTQEQIDKINNYGPVNVLQKTPIRVLHRRPLATRNKTIYKIRADIVEGKPNLIDLHLNTQAGTYVKEFVHGDFGRTSPNIGEIIGTEIDIIALDVTAINLDWPTAINYDVAKSTR